MAGHGILHVYVRSSVSRVFGRLNQTSKLGDASTCECDLCGVIRKYGYVTCGSPNLNVPGGDLALCNVSPEPTPLEAIWN